MILGKGLIADPGIFVILFGLCEFLVGYDFVLYQRLHTFIFLSGYIVSDTGALYGITIGNVTG